MDFRKSIEPISVVQGGSFPKIFNHILDTSYSTSEDVSTNPNDQNNNNPSSNNGATRAINLHD